MVPSGASCGFQMGPRRERSLSATSLIFGASRDRPSLTVAGDQLFFRTNSSAGRELHVVNTTDMVDAARCPDRNRGSPLRNDVDFLNQRFSVSSKAPMCSIGSIGMKTMSTATGSMLASPPPTTPGTRRAPTMSLPRRVLLPIPSTVISCPSSDREITLSFQ